MLSELDKKVLGLIPRNGGRASNKYIREILGLTETEVKGAIERLRKEGIPVGASRKKPIGYYIARDREELNRGMVAFNEQIKTMQETAETMKKSHVNTWAMDIKNPNWRDNAQALQVVTIEGKRFPVSFKLSHDDTNEGEFTIPPEAIELLKKKYPNQDCFYILKTKNRPL